MTVLLLNLLHKKWHKVECVALFVLLRVGGVIWTGVTDRQGLQCNYNVTKQTGTQNRGGGHTHDVTKQTRGQKNLPQGKKLHTQFQQP